MKDAELIANALDGLFGACDSLLLICQEQLDHKDGRIADVSVALAKAQDAIMELHRSIHEPAAQPAEPSGGPKT